MFYIAHLQLEKGEYVSVIVSVLGNVKGATLTGTPSGDMKSSHRLTLLVRAQNGV